MCKTKKNGSGKMDHVLKVEVRRTRYKEEVDLYVGETQKETSVLGDWNTS